MLFKNTVMFKMFFSMTMELWYLSQYSDWAVGWTTRLQFLGGTGMFLSSPLHPDWLWGPSSVLSKEY